LAPHSPGTDQIDTLLWIGFVAATVVVVVVNAALIYALRRYRASRGAEPREATGGRGVQLRAAGALTAFAAVLFVLGVIFTDRAREAPTTGPDGLQAASKAPLEIEATGQQWIWRYDYPNEAFSYYKLVIPVDTAVAVDLVSTDVVHTWDVPALAGKHDAVPGKRNRVVLLADEEGTFPGHSATLSGQGYASMRTEVQVVSPEEYEEFIDQTESDIEAAQARISQQLQGGQES
jgi:cytochrome c oxidase subunit II